MKALETDGESWRIDTTRWPIMIITVLSPSIRDDCLRKSLSVAISMLAERGGPYSLVLDNRLVNYLPAMQRKMIADSMALRAERARSLCRGMALVMVSPLVKGLLTAIFWLRQPVIPTRVFTQLDEALVWAREVHSSAEPDSPTHVV
jgi:hypothetical protein